MSSLPDAAVGPIIAALIAAVLSYVGLVVSKEQKTSEFRQTWIDSLRGELADYLSAITLISDLEVVKHKTEKERITYLKDAYAQLNKASYLISLRLNPGETGPAALIQHMHKLRSVIYGGDTITTDISPLESEFISKAQLLLKSEWKRVKHGEFVFRSLKWIVIAGVLILGYLVYGYVGQDRKGNLTSHAPLAEKTEPAPAIISNSTVAITR